MNCMIMEISSSIDSAVSHIERMNHTLVAGVGGFNLESYINKSKNFLIAGRLIVEDGQATELPPLWEEAVAPSRRHAISAPR